MKSPLKFNSTFDYIETVAGVVTVAGSITLLATGLLSQLPAALLLGFGLYLLFPGKAEKFAKLADRIR